MSGEKVTAVRWNEDVPVGAAVFVFDEHPTASPVPGTVIAVRRYRLDTLTDMKLFAHQPRENYYPDMPPDAVVEVARLAIETSQ